ncbi:long-chain-fatty-acid--CoA ligase [Pseudohalioglobus lutimaris]|uniref:Acyl-CoA synthase n=1 Tax=Pseudohalioglobus lutimaris TaxID=1737061 RepID=A0A2N5X6M5_9GAMM|nr:long-chain-fatty-acid--CoA ligase [Pseudohalioglobus lutimaris]PLW70120.1 acyl-CoA synthase [Pseudohalioglobus lutimaris]
MLVYNFLDYYARNTPDLPCLTQHGVTYSYRDVALRSLQLANGLLQLGVCHGHRVAILGENSLEHLLLAMAAGRIGAVTVSLNHRLAPAELAFIISDAETGVLLAPEMKPDAVQELKNLIAGELVVLGEQGADCIEFHPWLAQQSAQVPDVSVTPGDALLQLYTSGTTGNPKGVVISHFNVLSLCAMNDTAAPRRASAGMAAIICAPLFHIGGMGSLLFGIYKGLNTLLHRSFDPLQFVDDVEQYPVSNVFMVPAMIMAILQIPGIEQRNFSNLTQVFYGASPISESVLRKAMAVFQCDFVQMYGMTETTGTVVNLSADDHRRALEGKPELLRSCGRPSVGAEVRIVDSHGKDVATGEIGEIWLKSDTNMQSYYNLPEATAESLTDGWVHTGDAGYQDEDGYLYLKDRMKDMVVSGGENIYPVEVENAIAQHPAVADVAVIGVPDDKYGESLLAFIVLNVDAELEVEELIDFCRDKIAGYKIPRQMRTLEVMPRNASGKILKKVLREPFWQGTERNIG